MNNIPIDVYGSDPNCALQRAARAAHAQLPDCGFILIKMNFGIETETYVGYAANINREDAIKCLKRLLYGWGLEEEWMKNI
jgi:hypothetical protein